MMEARRRRRGKQESKRKVPVEEDARSAVARSISTSFGVWAILLASAACLLHSMYLANLFERDRFFSHLSPLERELSFRTEMGLYYSYYKTLVEAPSFSTGLSHVLQDNLTEYPTTINTLQRFNLYPEVCLSLMYRSYRWLLAAVGATGTRCLTISRGYGQSSVLACNGLGDAAYFYVHMIFFLNGLVAAAMVLLGTSLSGSLWGGVLCLAALFYNHGQSTRVMWTPPLRESFAMPFLFLQLLILSHTFKQRQFSWSCLAALATSSLAFLLPWQFSQFVLLTQVLAILSTHCLRLISSSTFLLILSALSVAFGANVVLQFANTMLLTSFLPPCLLACFVVCMLSKVTDRLRFLPLIAVVEVSTVLCVMVAVKLAVRAFLGTREDEHIVAILLSKFSTYRDFHTQLYTCAAEFDFISLSYVLDITLTLLLPMCICVVVMVGWRVVRVMVGRWKGDHVLMSEDVAIQTYHVVQMLAFAAMATLIMRLKLLLTPQLAVLTSLLPTAKLSRSGKQWLLAGLLLLSSVQGWHNILTQWDIMSEFNNPEGEELVQWVRDHTPQTAVFAGTMPTMAAILLTTRRPIVNHPHYESAELRNRTKLVYTIFSRKPPSEIHSILHGLGVDCVISEPAWCRKRFRPGCALSEVWDEEDPANQDNPIFCETLQDHTPHPFLPAFTNSVYQVLQVT